MKEFSLYYIGKGVGENQGKPWRIISRLFFKRLRETTPRSTISRNYFWESKCAQGAKGYWIAL
jgi:hypothetical protein